MLHLDKVGTCIALLAAGFSMPSQAGLIIGGVMDGTLPGGSPKAIVINVTADLADVSGYGVGIANNGGGTDGKEISFAVGDNGPEDIVPTSVSAGDVILLVNTVAMRDFFLAEFTDNFAGIIVSGNVNQNGDDAIELFKYDSDSDSDIVIDTFGQTTVSGFGEYWEYTDGYAVRTGGTLDPEFDDFTIQSQGPPAVITADNYDIVKEAFIPASADEQAHAELIAEAFGFTLVPEPGSFSLLAVGGLLLARRRR